MPSKYFWMWLTPFRMASRLALVHCALLHEVRLVLLHLVADPGHELRLIGLRDGLGLGHELALLGRQGHAHILLGTGAFVGNVRGKRLLLRSCAWTAARTVAATSCCSRCSKVATLLSICPS